MYTEKYKKSRTNGGRCDADIRRNAERQMAC